MQIETYYDEASGTFTYLLFDPARRDAVVIDPVLAFDPITSRVSLEPLEPLITSLRAQALTLHLILETHAHADHLSGAQELKAHFPEARLAIGQRITEVQAAFKEVFDLPEAFPTDGQHFDRLLEDGERVEAGALSFEVIATPGHTPACSSYRFGDAIFTGDALLMPDLGTGRCDFPGGSATDLYDSITRRLYALPSATRVFVGHDYGTKTRAPQGQTSIGAQKATNIQLPAGRTEDEFVHFRTARDGGLAAPRLLFQSVQVNIQAGNLPRFLKIPVNVFRTDASPTEQPNGQGSRTHEEQEAEGAAALGAAPKLVMAAV